MKRWIPALLGAAVLSGSTVGATLAQDPPEPPPAPPRGGRPERLGGPRDLERLLGLTEEQKSAVRQLQQERREAERPLREEERRLGETLRKALETDSPEPLAVGKAAIALHGARERLKAHEDAFHGRLLELLDEEQRRKLEQSERRPPRPPDAPPPPR